MTNIGMHEYPAGTAAMHIAANASADARPFLDALVVLEAFEDQPTADCAEFHVNAVSKALHDLQMRLEDAARFLNEGSRRVQAWDSHRFAELVDAMVSNVDISAGSVGLHDESTLSDWSSGDDIRAEIKKFRRLTDS